MSKIVRIKYRDHQKNIVEEICYLIEDSDNLVPKTTMETGLSFSLEQIKSEDHILLEDIDGLWGLPKDDLISMTDASEYDLQDYLSRN